MRSIISAFVFSLVAATGLTAQADNVVCRDGSTSVSGRGACSHHGGVEKHRSERKSTRKHAEPRIERHAEARHDRVRTRTEIDREPREQTIDPEPSWFERHFGRNHQADQPTARCNDGELSYSLQHRGACSQHGGVAQWLD